MTRPFSVHAPGNRIPDYAGDHYWVVGAIFRIAQPERHGPGGAPVMLDGENLVYLDMPCCFYCEQVWLPKLAAQPCPGDPEGN